jgi:hypothetical protein
VGKVLTNVSRSPSQRIIDVVQTVCVQARDAYTSVTDDSPPSFVASLTSLVFSFRITEFLTSGFTLSLPPPPPSSSAKGKDKDDTNEESNGGGSLTQTGLTTPKKGVGVNGLTSSMPKKDEKREENAFGRMPPEIVVILLPFYDLLNLNKAFCTLVFADSPNGSREFGFPDSSSRQLMMLASCHSSTSSSRPHLPIFLRSLPRRHLFPCTILRTALSPPSHDPCRRGRRKTYGGKARDPAM